MDTFRTIVLVAAAIVLVVLLGSVGAAMSSKKGQQPWPPVLPQCPDYWTFDPSGMCVNVKDLGTCPATNGARHTTMNFSVAPYVGSNALCAKYTWATNCGVAWDGITYGTTNPCQLTSSSSSS